MALEPNNQPPQNNRLSDREATPSDSSYQHNPLRELGESFRDISIKILGASDESRLSQILSDALGSAELVNQMAGCLTQLCADPSEEALQFKNRLYRVIATQIDALGGDNLLENIKKLLYLSVIAATTIESSLCCPRELNHQGLQEITRATINLVNQLDEERGLLLDAQFRNNSGATTPLVQFNDWMKLYLQGMDNILRGLKSSRFCPSAELLSQCRELVIAQFEWVKEGMGPTNVETSDEAELWAQSLDLARIVADGSMEKPLREIAHNLLQWFNDGTWDIQGSPVHEEGANRAELADILLSLERAELYATRALLIAQESCEVELVWKEVLDTRALSSRVATIALQGLAKSDATETAEYVAKLLNRIGSPRSSQSLAKRYLDTFILVAATPGMHSVIMDSWQPNADYPVDPLRKERIIDCLEERLKIHDTCLARAKKKLEKCGEDSWSRRKIEKRASKDGVIWPTLALKTLQELVES